MLYAIFMAIKSLTSIFTKAKNALRDPLRQNSALCLMGDLMYIWSGAEYGNLLRSGTAMTGQALHIGGVLLGGNKKIGSYRMSDILMTGVVACGMGYVASGSNLFGFEDAPRYFEMAMGACISSGAASVLAGKGTLAKRFFQSATVVSFGSAFEPALHQNGPEMDWALITDMDWRGFLGATFFLLSARAAEKIPGAYKNMDAAPEKTI
ncbi:MAG: hypothetical protein CMH27_10785 [Micavibrio sp.]|nr:hypothetical protein [Micavibrio sp.]